MTDGMPTLIKRWTRRETSAGNWWGIFHLLSTGVNTWITGYPGYDTDQALKPDIAVSAVSGNRIEISHYTRQCTHENPILCGR
jgi:hypothetical protein